MEPQQRANLATWVFLWDQAVQRQAERILSAEFNDAQVDVMLFADALRNVLRGAETVLGKEHEAIMAFKGNVPNAVNVRDMFEHFDEYVQGKGKMQKAGVVEVGDWMPLHTKVGDDHYSVRIGGHWLNVRTASEASSVLMVAVQDAVH